MSLNRLGDRNEYQCKQPNVSAQLCRQPSSSPTVLPAQPTPAKVEELSESTKERAREASQGKSIDTYA
ncbi:hypothetical protein [Shewanella mangrovisoli]|uniref:hypothetical protein n=1 Tax=Shewanella mangrovisoli TaxID=2864211 RepID=UPI001C65E54F|nr:hypothetical protein [Shewanella mangrovisoli]QYK10918.1 hypothetical protein K0H60_09720 [Shewanella mangrovisoli]